MFWFIMCAIPVLISLGNGPDAILPNEPIMFTWWLIVGVLAIYGIVLTISFTPKNQKKREIEEAEWYLYRYQQLWNLILKDERSFCNYKHQIESIFYRDPVKYRNKMEMELFCDVWYNFENKIYHLPLVDTYVRTMGWQKIAQKGSEIYQPQYFGIINDEEKLKNWKPTFDVDYLK